MIYTFTISGVPGTTWAAYPDNDAAMEYASRRAESYGVRVVVRTSGRFVGSAMPPVFRPDNHPEWRGGRATLDPCDVCGEIVGHVIGCDRADVAR